MNIESSLLSDERLTRLHYKDGTPVLYASHLASSTWNRDGVHRIRQSRKSFTCTFGCSIQKGDTYVALEMMAGYGRLDSMVDFALCEFHHAETEALLGQILSSDVDTSEVLRAWIRLLG